MPLLWILILVLAIATVGYFAARTRAMATAGGDSRILHSLPNYYGMNAVLSALVPSLAVLALWLIVQPMYLQSHVAGMIPDHVIAEGSSRDLIMSDVRRIASGLNIAVEQGAMSANEASGLRSELTNVRERLAEVGVALGSDVQPEVLAAAQEYRSIAKSGSFFMLIVVLALAVLGAVYAWKRSHKDFRARNIVEKAVLGLLIAAASIAILTTLGIVMSMLMETMNFFSQYEATSFFFGIKWAPDFRGDSALGILPLLWGTLYISLIALLVAVPVGLFAAIYMSEYAGPKLRAVAKPLIEILAGIPTIVYGLFALLTVGPLLRDYFAKPTGLGESADSVLTAGLVMGIMLIPFVSSLSDDIINAVPQSMRDGSLGLGATKSETIRQVIVPAALPGIVGAVLLATSRAIGETMIVVMGAGAAAAQLDKGLAEAINPLEAMTTVTTRIVSQLTGDTDFAAPETLVAFALGLTLFVITLGLNVLALYIVRKYREQYE
ncbi:phosphate ABC transporter permease subunit PstC [Halocynthiibacter styelae]|uniref:Phosphate transport system permease protein n=1 Tax=Halocynthiibacter styelae TaxID=2761955 RepID=A0A8J7IV85_9RHOB|nr:phosphate ABC transporter permease subunit PstC [Paenihalocynthiibacter styelae]MBI1492130.1 phosphate ABC transporter permease subunit PstC [Paenihalocynthiibacter styelae]